MIFIGLLAYSGAILGVSVLLYVGCVLMRRTTAVHGVAAFIGDTRAPECVDNGSFSFGQARAVGSFFLFVAVIVSVCVIRGIWH